MDEKNLPSLRDFIKISKDMPSKTVFSDLIDQSFLDTPEDLKNQIDVLILTLKYLRDLIDIKNKPKTMKTT